MKSINLFKEELAILWEDNQETIISYSLLRKLCPCAFCSGETDVLGKTQNGSDATKPQNRRRGCRTKAPERHRKTFFRNFQITVLWAMTKHYKNMQTSTRTSHT